MSSLLPEQEATPLRRVSSMSTTLQQDSTGAHRFLAFDLGAESGRGVVGSLQNGRLELEVLGRFPTEGITMLGRRQWDVTRMYGEMLQCLREYVRRFGPELDGIAVDTWGVDFGLLAADGTLLANPTHYRDTGHANAMQEAFEYVSREDIYRSSGIQLMPINSVFQLMHQVRSGSPLLGVADRLLLMGDLFGYLLSGRAVCEYTNASTTQLLDPRTREWNLPLIQKLDLPRHVFTELVRPGTILGKLLPEVCAATGMSLEVPVIAPATHDTGSAVAAVPVDTASSAPWAYLSSGTWSLLGAEVPEPVITDRSMALNFTNEGGVEGTIRLLKNIIGLWVVQECRRRWESVDGQKLDYGSLTAEAAQSPAFAAVVDVDDPRLLAPADMPATLQELAREQGFEAPQSRGAILRCALESLALRYRRTLHELDSLTGQSTGVLHVIGGGCQNELLCQMTADACGIPVMAGPVEATAAGNVLLQALATGAVNSLADGRRIIAESFPARRYEPRANARWLEMASRLSQGKAELSARP